MTKILLVDDERAASNLLRLSLELDGFDVTVCHTLDDARRSLTSDIQAVIVDYHLPQGTSGLTLLQEVREGETIIEKATPVVVTSGDDRCKEPAAKAGASIFLDKPFSPSRLSELLGQLISPAPSSDGG